MLIKCTVLKNIKIKYMKTQIYKLDVKHTLQSYNTRDTGSFVGRLGRRWRRRHPVGDTS